MRRGEIWTVSVGKDYAGKPRPLVIIQEDAFEGTDSVTVCAFTADPTEAPLFRLDVAPTDVNGLDRPSRLMGDKITTMPRTKLGQQIGCLDDADMLRLNRVVAVFLGIAG